MCTESSGSEFLLSPSVARQPESHTRKADEFKQQTESFPSCGILYISQLHSRRLETKTALLLQIRKKHTIRLENDWEYEVTEQATTFGAVDLLPAVTVVYM
ncbi:hypothetical protein T265_01522 [Opisthorchis viverrini]|uniref:Uncharacterized protein n=1 Tax=Opisthorchis viverrini TaxID=6198 RepID=A0A074ZZF9_OPIVI|nr:hypothetical protein T265_01522 [Opisthorchis viverrini]KER32471.1 hypothetical protein T265_01522 [Opisthorchis viverrini]